MKVHKLADYFQFLALLEANPLSHNIFLWSKTHSKVASYGDLHTLVQLQ